MLAEFKGKTGAGDYKAALKKNMVKFLPFTLCLGVVAVALGIAGIVTREDVLDLVLGIFLTAFGCAVPFLFYGIVYFLGQRQITSNKTYFGGSFVYRFEEDEFFQELTTAAGVSASQVRYTALYRVFDYKDMFLLYISNTSMIPIAKASLTAGDCAAVSARLAALLPGKYKRKFK